MQSNVWLTIILLAWASAQQAGAQEEHAKRPPPVSVQAVGPHAVGGGARYSADIQPLRQVDLAFKVGGYIQEILQMPGVDGQKRTVQEGDRLRAL